MIHLVPMTAEEYGPWLDKALREYAKDNIRIGRWHQDNALQEAGNSFSRVLTGGLETKDNFLFSLWDPTKDQKVGYLWFAITGTEEKKAVYVYDFLIFEPFRRQGYGTEAFSALEDKVKDLGLNTIALHVFGHNVAARKLYQNLGYIETNVGMRKDLAARE